MSALGFQRSPLPWPTDCFSYRRPGWVGTGLAGACQCVCGHELGRPCPQPSHPTKTRPDCRWGTGEPGPIWEAERWPGPLGGAKVPPVELPCFRGRPHLPDHSPDARPHLPLGVLRPCGLVRDGCTGVDGRGAACPGRSRQAQPPGSAACPRGQSQRSSGALPDVSPLGRPPRGRAGRAGPATRYPPHSYPSGRLTRRSRGR